MKKHLLWLTLILMAVFSSAAVSANAQSNYSVRADVPFDFTVGSTTIRAGQITVRATSAADAGPLKISNYNASQQTFRMARRLSDAKTSDHAKLVFNRYGDRYFLAQIWIPGTNAWGLPKSSSEKTVEREMRVAVKSQPEVVTIFAAMQ